jgi:hypothetical protein
MLGLTDLLGAGRTRALPLGRLVGVPNGVVDDGGPGGEEVEGNRVQDGGGDAGESAAFQLRVVLDADPGEGGDLPATQARHSAAAHLGQSRLLRGDLGSP